MVLPEVFPTRKSVVFVHGDISDFHGLLYSFLVNIRKTKGTPLCVLIQLLLQQQQGMQPVKIALIIKHSRNFIISCKNFYERVLFSNVASQNLDLQPRKSTCFTETPISPFCTCVFSNTVTSEMKVFTTIVQGWKPLTIVAKNSILNVAGSWSTSVYKYYSIISCLRNFQVMFYCLPSPRI